MFCHEEVPRINDASFTAPAGAVTPHPGPGVKFMTVGGVRAPIDQALAESGYDYGQFACLAGPLTRPDPGTPYRVKYRSISHSRREWLVTRLIALVLVTLSVVGLIHAPVVVPVVWFGGFLGAWSWWRPRVTRGRLRQGRGDMGKS